VASYLLIAPGDPYSEDRIDLSVKTLYATGLFADVAIEPSADGNILIRVIENPIINRVILEGNKSLKSDKITDEIEAEPRSIFTRTNVQADVQRIIELYRQSGRFAATVSPKVVQQPQNRVDLIFEITEGPVTGVKRINIIGNSEFPDRRLRKEIVTAESPLMTIMTRAVWNLTASSSEHSTLIAALRTSVSFQPLPNLHQIKKIFTSPLPWMRAKNIRGAISPLRLNSMI